MIILKFPWKASPESNPDIYKASPPGISLKITSVSFKNQVYMPEYSSIELFGENTLEIRGGYLYIFDTQKQAVVDYIQCLPEVQCQIFCLQKEAERKHPDDELMIKITHKNHPGQEIIFIVKIYKQCSLRFFRIHLRRQYMTHIGMHEVFRPVQRLGRGITALVYHGIRLDDNVSMAIKAFKKSTYFAFEEGKGKLAFLKEWKILSQCNHKNISQFEGTFETENSIYIIMQRYTKSLTAETLHKNLTFQTIRDYMKDLLQGVNYLHSKGIMHRDIKLQNIMLRQTQSRSEAVLIDLGMAEYCNEEQYLYKKCGTPGHIAPQMFLDQRSAQPQKCDIFSLGVVLYQLLIHKSIFPGKEPKQILAYNRIPRLAIDWEKLDQQDERIKSLLLGMIQLDYTKRFSALEALEHPVFANNIANPAVTSPLVDVQYQCIEPLNLNEEDKKQAEKVQ